MVGGDYIERNYEAAAVDGRIVQIAFQGPSKATVDFRPILMLKRLHPHRLDLRPRPVADKAAIAQAAREQGLAADRGRQGQAGDLQDLPAAPRPPPPMR